MKTFNSLKDLAAHVNKSEEARLLGICAITGRKGEYGKDIVAAKLAIERDGIEEVLRCLIHKSVKTGRRISGKAKIRGITKKGMKARVSTTIFCGEERRYVMVTG